MMLRSYTISTNIFVGSRQGWQRSSCVTLVNEFSIWSQPVQATIASSNTEICNVSTN